MNTQAVKLLPWQSARFGESLETMVALAYWRDRGWPVDNPNECPDDRIYNFKSGYRAALSRDEAAPSLVALVREWQEARKPVGLSAPGVGVAEAYQQAVRRMSAADEALAAYRLDDDEAETPAVGKRAQTPNEAAMLRALSDALTGGNASTWEQILHSAEQHRSESGAPVIPEGPTTNVPLVADMLAASLHAQAVKSRGECPTCGGVWPCDRCTTRAVDLDALKARLSAPSAASEVETLRAELAAARAALAEADLAVAYYTGHDLDALTGRYRSESVLAGSATTGEKGDARG